MKVLIILALVCSASAQLSTVTNCAGYTGTAPGGTPVYGNHADPYIAVSATSILQVTGEAITAYDKSCNILAGYPIFTKTFMANNSGGSISQMNDPRCTYNPHINRFIVQAGTNQGPLFNVSSGSDLSTATWKAVTINGTDTGDTTPHVGWNKWWVVVAYDDPFSTTNYKAYAIPAADVAWTGGGTIDLSHMVGSGDIDYESFPAMDRSTTTLVGDPLILYGRGTPPQNCTNCTVTLHCRTVTGSNSTTPSFSGLTDIVTSDKYNTPNTGPNQPGTSNPIRTIESHRGDLIVQIGTHAYLAMNTGPVSETYNGFVVFDVNPSTLTLNTSKRVFDSTTDAYLFTAPSVDTSGNLVICGTLYSNTVYASVACWYSTDQLATLNGPTVMYSGTLAYPVSGANTGWGTYGATVFDPANNTFWITQQSGDSNTANLWTTRIVEVTLSSVGGGSAMAGKVTLGGKVVIQ